MIKTFMHQSKTILTIKACFTIALFSIVFSLCTKDNTEPLPAFVQKLISQNTSCECDPYINEYEWRNKTIYLLFCNGPACDCIPLYYDVNGNSITMSSGYTFENFYNESKLLKKVWKCGQ